MKEQEGNIKDRNKKYLNDQGNYHPKETGTCFDNDPADEPGEYSFIPSVYTLSISPFSEEGSSMDRGDNSSTLFDEYYCPLHVAGTSFDTDQSYTKLQ